MRARMVCPFPLKSKAASVGDTVFLRALNDLLATMRQTRQAASGGGAIPKPSLVRTPAAAFSQGEAKRFMTEQRKAHRVVFEKGYAANIMAIDGTWRRPCAMLDVSDTGARISIDGSVEGLAMKEFFLLLSTVGRAYRRCELAWVNGDQVGVRFIKASEMKKKSP